MNIIYMFVKESFLILMYLWMQSLRIHFFILHIIVRYFILHQLSFPLLYNFIRYIQFCHLQYPNVYFSMNLLKKYIDLIK